MLFQIQCGEAKKLSKWSVGLICTFALSPSCDYHQWTSSWLIQINIQHCIFHSTFSYPSGFFFSFSDCFRLTVPTPLNSSFHCYADEAQLTCLYKSKWDESQFWSLCLPDKNVGARLKWTIWIPAAITRSNTSIWCSRWVIRCCFIAAVCCHE